LLDRLPQSPRRLLVQLQDALLWLASGELARQEAEVLANSELLLEKARTELRKAIRKLTDLQPVVEIEAAEASRRHHRAASRNTDDPGADDLGADDLTGDEWASLQKSIAYHLARAHQNQGRCYPLDSADRANSLSAALEAFRRLASLSIADEMVWQSRIEEVVCHRLLSDVIVARARLTIVFDQRPPPAILARARAEQIRLHLATGEVDTALREAAKLEKSVSPDFDYACLQTFLAARQAADKAGRRRQVAQWERRAVDQTNQIEQRHGPYWMRRAEILLASHTAAGASNVSALERAAVSYFRSGQRAEALATYDRAHRQALANRDRPLAFTLALTAAAIEQDAAHYDQAALRYRRVALQHSDDPRAAAAHLSAIVNTAQRVRAVAPADRRQPLEHYVELLHEHLEHWPDAKSAEQVRIWRADLDESQHPGSAAADRAAAMAAAGRVDEAIEVYQKLIEQYPHSGTYHEARAQLLTDRGDPNKGDTASLDAAMAAWQALQQKSRRGSPRWLRSRLAEAQIYLRRGDKRQAAKIIRLTQVLYPELGGEKLKAEFLRTLRACK
jgi:tetratricopeptide (TPR) repeat protein